MTTISYNDAQNYLEHLQSEQPVLADSIQHIIILFNQRLWHQLTEALDVIFKEPQFLDNVDLCLFYRSCIKAFEHRMNPLRLVRLLILVAEQMNDLDQRLSFLEDIVSQSTIESSTEATIEGKSYIATLLIQMDRLDEAKDLLRTQEDAVNEVVTDDSGVYSIFHYAFSEYYRSVGDPQNYYESCLQYLAYTDMASFDSDLRRINFAYNFGLAALMGKKMFNFGELLEHPIIESLENTQYAWLGAILSIFNQGDSSAWNTFQNENKDILNQIPELVNNIPLLEQKIGIMSIITHVFNKGNKSRTISYDELKEVTQRDENEVELLLMRAMSVGLLRGEIDQVKQIVNIDWVQPRVLNLEQIQSLGNQISSWISSVDTLMLQMEQDIPPGL
eukprot:TRINITY_DN5798_c0_g4_i2.p1 TRINITY_DN5798_c0_g4~~TRINITY_DN5798_c0_g4_i2.p1  ORF type:complete len:389 (+),score=92.95 TRINITY_DN5798_c0_g4_i2:30-1196(+)